MGSLVVLDGPPSLDFSIDSQAWQTGPLFRGLTGIPPGFHFLTFTIGGKRTSHMLFIDQGQTYILQWNSVEEQFEVGSFMPVDCIRLVPYPVDDMDESWRLLTGHITKELLTRVIGSENDGLYSFDQTWCSYHDPEQNNMGMFHYTEIDLLRPPTVNSAADITKFAIDKSSLLEKLIPSSLLGEFQLSFLILALGGNFSGLQQWNFILRLVCASTASVSQWFAGFVVVLREQVSSPFGAELFAELFQSSESPKMVRNLHVYHIYLYSSF